MMRRAALCALLLLGPACRATAPCCARPCMTDSDCNPSLWQVCVGAAAGAPGCCVCEPPDGGTCPAPPDPAGVLPAIDGGCSP